MPNNRREFLKMAGLTGVGLTGAVLEGFAASQENAATSEVPFQNKSISIIGQYGEWANSLNAKKLPSLSYRRSEWKDIEAWRKVARQKAIERLAIPDIGPMPKVTVKKQYSYDGLHIEELSWQLPYGRPTEAILLKPLILLS